MLIWKLYELDGLILMLIFQVNDDVLLVMYKGVAWYPGHAHHGILLLRSAVRTADCPLSLNLKTSTASKTSNSSRVLCTQVSKTAAYLDF